MNNYDLYREKLESGDYIAASKFALGCSAGCASRSSAWSWADEAIEAASKAGIDIRPALGRSSFPNQAEAERVLNASANPTVIVTRHTGLVEWLSQHNISGQVIAHATADDVRGKIVVGALPFHLAALAARVGVVDMPRLRPDQRGQDLTPAQMDEAGASLSWYVVKVAS